MGSAGLESPFLTAKCSKSMHTAWACTLLHGAHGGSVDRLRAQGLQGARNSLKWGHGCARWHGFGKLGLVHSEVGDVPAMSNAWAVLGIYLSDIIWKLSF